MRACIVQGSQQIWVTALWYWGHQLNGALPGSKAPWWIVILLWPFALVSFAFTWCLLKGLPGMPVGEHVPSVISNTKSRLLSTKST
jgi:alpha-1,3-glucan synthase